jgi:hypothetical protein
MPETRRASAQAAWSWVCPHNVLAEGSGAAISAPVQPAMETRMRAAAMESGFAIFYAFSLKWTATAIPSLSTHLGSW